MGRTRLTRTACSLMAVSILLVCGSATATEEFSEQTSLGCAECHAVVFSADALTETGQAFADGGYEWPLAEGAPGLGGTARSVLTVLFGLLHLLVAVAWVGTIFYIHLVLKPGYAAGGLPKTEMRLAWASMLLVLVSGAGLTWLRYPDLAALTLTRSGVLLLIKIGLFFFLVCSAAFVSRVLSPRLKRLKEGWQANDGRDGRPAWVRVGEKVYVVTGSPQWKDGQHFKRHQAGTDLTDALAGAPHCEDKLEAFESFPAQGAQQKHRASALRTLFVLAYLNLFVAAGVLVVVALRRWG